MNRFLGNFYRKTIGSSIGSLLLACIGIITILSGIIETPVQPAQVSARISQVSDHDSCNIIHLSFSENPSAPSCHVAVPTHTNSYSYTISPSTTDGKSHTFVYNTYNFFCPQGDLTNAFCKQNGISHYSQVWHSGDGPITLSRTPTDASGHVLGQFCGRYQMDFEIISVDNNSNCKFMGGNNTTPGSSGDCQTGQTCVLTTPTPSPRPTFTPTPTPTVTPTPTSKPTPTTTPSCTPSPTPSNIPSVTPTMTPTATPTAAPTPTPVTQVVTVVVQSVLVTATPTPTLPQVQVVTTTKSLPGTGSETTILWGLLALVPAGIKFRKTAENFIH